MRRNVVLCMAGFAILAAAGMAKANLIQNGDFETGGLPPWQVVLGEASVESAGFMGLFSPHGGNYMAVLSPDTHESSALAYFNHDDLSSEGPLSFSVSYNLVCYNYCNDGNESSSDVVELYFGRDYDLENRVLMASVQMTDLRDEGAQDYTATGWQSYTVQLEPGDYRGAWVGFALQNGPPYGSSQQSAMVLLDDVSLVPVPDAGSTGLFLAFAAGILLPAVVWLRPRCG